MTTTSGSVTLPSGYGGDVVAGRLGDHPCIAVGSGDRPLVLLPGVDDLFRPYPPGPPARLLLRRYFLRAYAREWRVWLVGRPRGLETASTRAMAAAYADVLDRFDRPVDVVGLSMGGLIAQHLAVDAPDRVRRLVLAVSGVRVGPAGRETLDRWRDWGRESDWRAVYRDSVSVVYGPPRDPLYRWLLPALGIVGAPSVVEDVGISCRACLDHDAAGRLDGVDAPTLVVGGTDDPFFPPDVLRETVDRLPRAGLALFEGAGHGLYEERKRGFDAALTRFLRA